jgi:hypothetical protein
MNKVAFIKDPHLMFGFSNNIRKPLPGSGANSWENSIRKKLEFIASHMKTNGISILLISGDLFEHSKLGDWTFNKYFKNKSALLEIFIDEGIELYSVQGNHDMFNGKAQINGTIFGELISDGIIQHLTIEPLEFRTQIGIIKIHGTDYSFTEAEQKRKFHIINNEESVINMVVSHTNITPNEEQLSDFTYQELSENYPNINVHLCGHYHLGYDPTIVNEVTFINPWNLTRVSREYQVKMDNHIPQLVLLDLDNYSNSNLDWVQTIEIPHLNFYDAFREEVVSILKENQKFKFFDSDEEVISLDNLVGEDLDDNQLLSIIINSVLTDKSTSEKQALLNKALEYLT